MSPVDKEELHFRLSVILSDHDACECRGMYLMVHTTQSEGTDGKLINTPSAQCINLIGFKGTGRVWLLAKTSNLTWCIHGGRMV